MIRPIMVSLPFLMLNMSLILLLIIGILTGLAYDGSKIWFIPFMVTGLILTKASWILKGGSIFFLLSFLSLPGVFSLFTTPSVAIYYLMFLLSIWSLVAPIHAFPALRANGFFFLSFFLLTYSIVMRFSFGALYLAVIQVSIYDMLLLAISLKSISATSGRLRPAVISSLLITYGVIFESRVLMVSPLIYFFLFYFSQVSPRALLRFSLVALGFLAASPIVLLLSFGLEDVRSITDVASLSVLRDWGFEEFKRVFLIMQGLKAIHYNQFLPTGYGYEAYFNVVGDSIFVIVPQYLPLTLAAYGGLHMPFVFFSAFFLALLKVSWMRGGVATLLTFLLFVMGHEYLFNPFFAVCIGIMRTRVRSQVQDFTPRSVFKGRVR